MNKETKHNIGPEILAAKIVEFLTKTDITPKKTKRAVKKLLAKTPAEREELWKQQHGEASGHRKTRMEKFAAKHGSKKLKGELRRKAQRKQRRAAARNSKGIGI